jgi:bifunctional non-homologous end joining protein LigD
LLSTSPLPKCPTCSKKLSFITPSAPALKTAPPRGDGWLHEVKFDGWRAQLHKDGDAVTIYSRNGKDLTERFSFVRDSIAALPASSAIIDAELVACDDDGRPDFGALMARTSNSGNVCAWCFDLLAHNDRDLRPLPLVKRKDVLRDILNAADDDTLRYADEFPDPEKLLAAIESMGLEGTVSKLVEQPYRSGKNSGWIKVKSKAWRAANRDRWERFESAK